MKKVSKGPFAFLVTLTFVDLFSIVFILTYLCEKFFICFHLKIYLFFDEKMKVNQKKLKIALQ